MNGPITNFDLGKIRHRELEAEVGRYQSEQAVKAEGQSSLTKLKLALTMTVFLGDLLAPFPSTFRQRVVCFVTPSAPGC